MSNQKFSGSIFLRFIVLYHKNASKYEYKRIKYKSFNGIYDCKILNRIAKDKGDGIFETVKYKYKTNSNKKKEYI